MTSRVGYLMHACVVLAAFALLSGTAAAQDQVVVGQGSFLEVIGTTAPDPLPPGGPTPRMADGRPDLSGCGSRASLAGQARGAGRPGRGS